MRVSLVMPVYNGGSTVGETLKSIISQRDYFDELIIINDGSRDDSNEVIAKIISNQRFVRVVENRKPGGLAAAYNKGIKISKGEIVVTIHQDIILKREALKKLLNPLKSGKNNIVASTHTVMHPRKIWGKYNFWQQCLFSRLVEKRFSGLDGKFDAFKKEIFKKVGYFDSVNYRTAGEDGDMWHRLKKEGTIADSGAQIIHIHSADPNFGPKNIIQKQAQYSETQGVQLRRGIITTPRDFARSFFRELLLISLLIPYVRWTGLLIILVYSVLYTKEVFLHHLADLRIVILPFFNIFLLFVSFYYSLRGFLNGKQKV